MTGGQRERAVGGHTRSRCHPLPPKAAQGRLRQAYGQAVRNPRLVPCEVWNPTAQSEFRKRAQYFRPGTVRRYHACTACPSPAHVLNPFGVHTLCARWRVDWLWLRVNGVGVE